MFCMTSFSRIGIQILEYIIDNVEFSTYRIFKDSIKMEEYISYLPSHLMYSLLNFRTGSFILPSNCRSNIPRVERSCRKCDLRQLGDEYNFLFECPVLEGLRHELIPEYFRNRPNAEKMSQLLNSQNKRNINSVAKFIHKGVKEYRSFPDINHVLVDTSFVEMFAG